MNTHAPLPPLPRWVILWSVISIAVVLWDTLFVVLRPMSMEGGALSFLWLPYSQYVTVDLSYGNPSDPFTLVQAIMSQFEIAVLAVGIVFNAFRQTGLATLLVFFSCSLTWAKTTLIFLQEWASGLANVGHNSAEVLWLQYIVPNSVWVVVPLLVVLVTGRRLLRALPYRGLASS